MHAKIPLNKITKIAIIQTNGKKTLTQVKAQTGCQYIINGTLYDFNDFDIKCPCRIDGKTMATSKDGYWCYGWQTGPDISMVHSKDMLNYQNLFSCCAMLKDGQNTYMSYTKTQGGVRGRTAIGIDNQNNLVLFCSSDRNGAISPEKLRSHMKYDLHCQSAIMLDSGGSSQCDFNGKKITSSRKVANYICIWTEKITQNIEPAKPIKKHCPYQKPNYTIRAWSRGTGAKWVQWHLNETINANLNVDGIFGPKSVNALKDFQRKFELTVDGLCGRNTRNMLENVLARR